MYEALAKQIGMELVKSSEFGVLKKTREQVEKNIQAKRSLEQFHIKRNSICGDQRILSEQDMKNVKDQFDLLMKNPDIAAYYNAERKFFSLVGHVHQLIDSCIDREFVDNPC